MTITAQQANSLTPVVCRLQDSATINKCVELVSEGLKIGSVRFIERSIRTPSHGDKKRTCEGQQEKPIKQDIEEHHRL